MKNKQSNKDPIKTNKKKLRKIQKEYLNYEKNMNNKQQEQLLFFDLADRDGDKSVYIYGYNTSGMKGTRIITRVEIIKTPIYEK